MTTHDRGRGPAMIWFLTAVVIAAAAWASCPAEAPAQTDGSSPPAVITYTAGDFWTTSGDGAVGGNREGGRGVVQVKGVGEWDHYHHATPVGGRAIGTFRHYRHESGPQSCLFTATQRTTDGFLMNVGGGRDCPRSSSDPRCGAISQEFFVFVLAGGACEAFNVPPCGGVLPCY